MISKKDIKDRFDRTIGGAFQGIDIITDKQTGVQYLLATKDGGGGLSPLIDQDGKPLLAKTAVEAKTDPKAISPF
ncbi:MAG: DUF6440 family protein [Streptococcaceae bacterium]|nr:DUF6440 family protein [Streptococcaceae bacterium]